MTDVPEIETFPLFPDLQPCGCPVGSGHTCKPPFAEEWDTHPQQVKCPACGDELNLGDHGTCEGGELVAELRNEFGDPFPDVWGRTGADAWETVIGMFTQVGWIRGCSDVKR